jgi:hypothetical protein
MIKDKKLLVNSILTKLELLQSNIKKYETIKVTDKISFNAPAFRRGEESQVILIQNIEY